MRDRQNCIDCGKQSPETETNYTLISAQFGWRLSRRRDRNGDFIVEWRCAECWRDHKKKTDAEAASGSPAQAKTEAPDSARRPVPPPLAPRSGSATAAANRASSRPPPKPSTKPSASRPPSQAPGSGPPAAEGPRGAPPVPRRRP